MKSHVRYFKNSSCKSLLVAAVCLLSCSSAQAGFIAALSGNGREVAADGGIKITNNFALLDRFAGRSVPGDVFGTGLAGFDNLAIIPGGVTFSSFDTSARYLYLYQVVIDPGSSAGLDFSFVPFADEIELTSWAQWGLQLADDDGPIGPSNQFGPDNVPFQNGGGANLGIVNPRVEPASAVLVPGVLDLVPEVLGLGRLSAISADWEPDVPPGLATTLVGFTSDFPPAIFNLDPSLLPPDFVGGSFVAPSLILTGDINANGFVGAGDLDILLGQWNQFVAIGSSADLNVDGFVGAGDLDILLANWNVSVPGNSMAAVLPEPTMFVLLTSGGTAVTLRRRPR